MTFHDADGTSAPGSLTLHLAHFVREGGTLKIINDDTLTVHACGEL